MKTCWGSIELVTNAPPIIPTSLRHGCHTIDPINPYILCTYRYKLFSHIYNGDEQKQLRLFLIFKFNRSF